MILVTGAGGKTGRAVMRALLARGESVRGLVRTGEHAAQARALGAQEAVTGDMRDPAALERAAHGARAIYHICPNISPDEVEIGRAALAAARAAGVERFVYHSVLHPQTPSMVHHWNKLAVEAALFESGLAYTILQPASYMQNVLGSWKGIVEQGVYSVPYSVETRLGMVDLDDVAEVAARALTEPGHAGATYELCGPEALTQTEVAGLLARALGRPVRAVQVALPDWAARARSGGLGETQVETLLKMFDYYDKNGFWGNPRVLAHLLGRAPATFEAFVERLGREALP